MVSSSGKSEELKGLSWFVGFSAPEVPKYIVLNNFLSEYFKSDSNIDKEYVFEDFSNVLICQEGDEIQLEKLKESFNQYFTAYTGKVLLSKGSKCIYLPISKEMLRTGEKTLRSLLFRLQYRNATDYKKMQDKLEKFLYGENIGTNEILNFLCSKVQNEHSVFQLQPPKEKLRGDEDIDVQSCFKELSKQFNEDLDYVLTNKNFISLDYYRKTEYLSTLLTFYVVIYIIRRTQKVNAGKRNIIICKGSSNSKLNSGEFHRACTVNYAKIRDGFSLLFKQYYTKCLEGVKEVILKLENGVVKIKNQHGEGFINLSEFIKVKNIGDPGNNFDTKLKLIKAFSLDKVEEEDGVIKYGLEDFVTRYINFQKRSSGSSIEKISSTLPSSGRECGIVFPLSSTRYKYFALSEETAEFFVRLYLSQKNKVYDYFDNFVSWLEDRYDICILKSPKVEKYLKHVNSKISMKEFNQNEDDFIENLNNINCLIKISDSGYVITLPEKKGEFKLL